MRTWLVAENSQALVHPAKRIQRLNRFGTTQLLVQLCGSTGSLITTIPERVSQPHRIRKLRLFQAVIAEQLSQWVVIWQILLHHLQHPTIRRETILQKHHRRRLLKFQPLLMEWCEIDLVRKRRAEI